MKNIFLKRIVGILIVATMLTSLYGVIAHDEGNVTVLSTTYGNNVKYEHLSNGNTRATIPFSTVYNRI